MINKGADGVRLGGCRDFSRRMSAVITLNNQTNVWKLLKMGIIDQRAAIILRNMAIPF